MAKGVYKDHYDVSKILKTKDKSGNKPEVYFIVSRGRGVGKTYSIAKYFIESFYESECKSKFIIITRKIQDLQGGAMAEGVLKGYLDNERPDVVVEEKCGLRGVFNNIYLCAGTGDESIKVHCGYVIPLAAAGDIKKVSSMFVDADRMFMDEFIPLKGSKYLTDEVALMDTIHTSVARGGGQAVRYVPLFMCANAIDKFNRYFVACGLHKKIQANTRLYVGDGYVYERCIVPGLSEKRAETGFAKTFKTDENDVEDDNTWISEASSVVCKPDDWGEAWYSFTLKRKNEKFGVKFYPQVGFTYIDRKPDGSCDRIYALTLGDDLNVPFIKGCKELKWLRERFLGGCVRCSDSGVLDAIMDLFCA